MKEVAAANSGNPRQDVKNDESRRAIQLFNLRPDDPKRIGIKCEMQQSDVNEYWSDKAPPLPACDERVVFHTEGNQRLRIAAARQRHQSEDENIDAEEDVREQRPASPDCVQEL